MNIDCTNIYEEEIEKRVKTLKRFREAWLKSSATWDDDLFQYADSDFYYYRFAIERQERSTGPLLTDIIYRVMAEYGKCYVDRDDVKGTPFEFIVCDRNKRIGYRYIDFCENENVNEILDYYDIDIAYIIRTWKPGKSDNWIEDENLCYREEGVRLAAISIKTFYEKLFGEKEYDLLLAEIEKYLQEARNITGYQSIKFLSSMNLATQKLFEEKLLADWNYEGYNYQIINSDDKEIKKYRNLSQFVFPEDDLIAMKNNYIGKELYKTMIGLNEYAESFITSEWLYHSLKEKSNFDYTSVISGYLKSIEQLLFQIVLLNIENKCKIAMNSNLLKDAYNNNVPVYDFKKNRWELLRDNKDGNNYIKTKYPYIDFTLIHKDYMDSSIGTFEYFIRRNPKILINPKYAKEVADMVSCFRTECRNGFFHTHNLNDWDVVEKTRDNAIYLYFVLLGSSIIPEKKKVELGILSEDRFDSLCMKIRDFSHYNTSFIFEYDGGEKIKLSYDSYNNTIEYSNEGVEHYEKLLFHKVDEFTMEEYEKLYSPEVRENRAFYLTRDNIPNKIFGIHGKRRNHEAVEIEY